MGQIRLETVSRLLTCEPEVVDDVLKEYANTKKLQWMSKYADHSDADIFVHGRARSHALIHQLEAARLFLHPRLRNKISDQSPPAAAAVSEGLAQIIKCTISLREVQSNLARVQTYDRILQLMIFNTEPLVRAAAARCLMQLHEDTPRATQRESLLKPLAVAICLRFTGEPSSKDLRNKVDSFVNQHFSLAMGPLAQRILAELGRTRRKETTELLKICHAADLYSVAATRTQKHR